MDGGPCSKFWESQEIISQMETVRSWIGKHYKKVSELMLDSKRTPIPEAFFDLFFLFCFLQSCSFCGFLCLINVLN